VLIVPVTSRVGFLDRQLKLHCYQDVVQVSGGSRKKYLEGAGPSSFVRQQRLSEITIEPIKNLGPGQPPALA